MKKTGSFSVFDAQVNYGKSIFGPDCDINTYIENVPLEVTDMLLIPTGTHDVVLKDGTKELSCIWNIKDGCLEYKKILISSKNEETILNPKNPYLEMNNYVLDQVKQLNKDFSERNFYFAPKLHPKLDEKYSLEKIIGNPLVKAIKIQGLATYSSPDDVPPWAVAMAKEKDTPFLVHTDYYNPNFTLENVKPIMHDIMNKNTPSRWFDWGVKNNVRLFLAHGIRLDLELIKKINGKENIVVGIGPESLMNEEKARLYTITDDYLTELMKNINPQNLIFCSDYRWNVKKRNEWDDLDWDSHKKVINQGLKIGLSNEDIHSILYKNAINFFRCEK